MVGNGIQKPTDHNIEKVRDCREPTTNTEAKAFCNLAGFYRKFIKNYAKKAKPLTDLASIPGKKVKIVLDEKAKKAFEKIKRLVTSRTNINAP